ncbi:hypothetical protein EJ08DRAFT_279005 [Tothia fuscella]|uniref:DRBM domain-containing protein n=1 Tax=Tothia fuscella TaxID=1048955 RepID=A0A9P4NPU0_9PEZI|nr:hypothetical protein EJ08DRAFT_279005 [Tothia fuscella]
MSTLTQTFSSQTYHNSSQPSCTYGIARINLKRQRSASPTPQKIAAMEDTSRASSSCSVELIGADEQKALWDLEDAELAERLRTQKAEQVERPKMQVPKGAEPVPIHKSTSAFVARLNMLAQKRGIPCDFDCPQVGGPRNVKFEGVLKLGDKSFRTEEAYSSKKEAKEAVAERGLNYLQGSPVETATPQHRKMAVPISRSTTKGNIAALQIEMQKRGAGLPVYDLQEVGQQQFSGSVTILGHVLSVPGFFGSKKDAKEAAARKGLDYFAEHAQNLDDSIKDAQEEKWVSILNGYMNHDGVSCPTYDFYMLDLQFACEVTIPDHDGPFGSQTQPFRSQKLAQANAAREAVLWLRQKGLLNDDDRPAKRRKSENSFHSVQSHDDTTTVGKSYGQHVTELCKKLDITTPEYICVVTDGSFTNCAAHFVSNFHISRGEPIGVVENVFGKAKAKEECAKEVVRFLEEYIRKATEGA